MPCPKKKITVLNATRTGSFTPLSFSRAVQYVGLGKFVVYFAHPPTLRYCGIAKSRAVLDMLNHWSVTEPCISDTRFWFLPTFGQ